MPEKTTPRNPAAAERARLHQALAAQQGEIRLLQDVVSYIARTAGLTTQVTAIIQGKTADEANPANPVPEPAAEAPAETTEEALAGDSANPVKRDQPEGGNSSDLLSQPGAVPGTTDVSADATTTVDTPGADIQTPAITENQDVTAPVEGTQGPQPLNDVKIETDVRVGDPNNAQTFDGVDQLGPAQKTTGSTKTALTPEQEAEQERLRKEMDENLRVHPNKGATGSARTFASLRLARLRRQAGITTEEDIPLAEKIAGSDADDELIAAEIATLAAVVAAQASRTPARRPRSLVPVAANVQRTAAAEVEIPIPEVAASVQDDEVSLFD